MEKYNISKQDDRKITIVNTFHIITFKADSQRKRYGWKKFSNSY